jgi:hypothetical protein
MSEVYTGWFDGWQNARQRRGAGPPVCGGGRLQGAADGGGTQRAVIALVRPSKRLQAPRSSRLTTIAG